MMEEQVQEQQVTTQSQQKVEPKTQEEIHIQEERIQFFERNLPSPVFGLPSLPTIKQPVLPMGTITETITIPAVPATIHTYNTSYTKPKKMFTQGEIEQIKTEPNGTITIKREICDGEVNLGPFKSCLKEFTGVSAIGWIFAAAGLIVLWKWLEWRFKK